MVFGTTSMANLTFFFCEHLRSTRIHIATLIELLILVLTLVGIRRASQSRESRLARLLKNQGLAYFLTVFFIHLSVIASGLGSLETDVR